MLPSRTSRQVGCTATVCNGPKGDVTNMLVSLRLHNISYPISLLHQHLLTSKSTISTTPMPLSKRPTSQTEMPGPEQHPPPPAQAPLDQQQMMEPPAYTPPAQIRSIASLRAQIIANGSVIRPRNDVNKSSDDHIELVVAKTPSLSQSDSSRGGNPRLHWSEKDALRAATNRGSDPMRPHVQPGASGDAGGGVGMGQKHYAVLIRRSGGSKSINVIGMSHLLPYPGKLMSVWKGIRLIPVALVCAVQGEPRDTVEEALEWMLERTEQMCHDLIVRNGKPDSMDTCVVM